MGKPAVKPAVSTTDYVAGLRKTGPGQYAVVTGVVVDGEVLDWKADSVAQPLQFAAEALRLALRKLLDETP